MPKNLKFEDDVIKHQNNYINLVDPNYLKSNGQYFTPIKISKWMYRWVNFVKPKTILDPAVGFGSLLIKFLGNKNKITSVEKDKTIYKKIKRYFPKRIKVFNTDFFNLDKSYKFDGIISNPPYIRFQKRKLNKSIFTRYDKITNLKLSRLSNIYILFCIDLIERLKKNGRAAIIIPNEWMNANFGESFKKYLYKKLSLKKIIYISHNSLVFEKNLSTASILLFDNNSVSNSFLDLVYVKNSEEFFNINPNSLNKDGKHWKIFRKDWEQLINIKKWDSIFDIKSNRSKNKFIKLGDIVTSKRGIATGANNFFLHNYSFIKKNNLNLKNYKNCIGKAPYVPSLIFKNDDFNNLKSEDKNIYLFDPIHKLSLEEKEFIKKGEDQKINKLYLTSKRKIWFQQEQRKSSPIWIPVFNRKNIKFILNETNCLVLTSFHNIYPSVFLNKDEITALVGLLNLNDMKEYIMSQKRVYGGGLIKIEPKDILDIEAPDIRNFSDKNIKILIDELKYADECYRNKINYISRVSLKDLHIK